MARSTQFSPSAGPDFAAVRGVGAVALAGMAVLLIAFVAVPRASRGVITQLAPTGEQRIAFQLEEHGYGVAAVTQLAPTGEQRIAFQLEEHGYGIAALAAIAPTPEQRIAFQLEEHGYDANALLARQ
jgi:hypothetical protein